MSHPSAVVDGAARPGSLRLLLPALKGRIGKKPNSGKSDRGLDRIGIGVAALRSGPHPEVIRSPRHRAVSVRRSIRHGSGVEGPDRWPPTDPGQGPAHLLA